MNDLGRYRLRKGLILAFHGCDASVANKVFGTNHHLSRSENDDDWLGHGVYFWENNPERALEWAGKKSTPAVIGAILDLGLCLDLTESAGCDEVKQAHQLLKDSSKSMPVNRSGPDTKRRYLDCAVIQYAHAIRAAAEPPLAPYSSVRAAFHEDEKLYLGAGFSQRAHIQICIRDMSCILGYFKPI